MKVIKINCNCYRCLHWQGTGRYFPLWCLHSVYTCHFGGCKGMICSVSTFQPFILDCRIVPMITAYTVYHRKPYMKDWHQRPMDVIQHFAWVCDLWWYIHVIVFVLSINMCSSLRLKKMKEARHACGVNEYNYLLKVGPFPWYPASWWPDYKVYTSWACRRAASILKMRTLPKNSSTEWRRHDAQTLQSQNAQASKHLKILIHLYNSLYTPVYSVYSI